MQDFSTAPALTFRVQRASSPFRSFRRYIPTGRGLAIERLPFSKLYGSFAASCFYPGFDMLALFVSYVCVAPGNPLNGGMWLIALALPVSLLWGATVFNPRQFERQFLLADVKLWFKWLCDTEAKDSWSAFSSSLLGKKKGSNFTSWAMPSKELMLAATLLLMSNEVLRSLLSSLQLRFVVFTLLMLPIAAVVAVGSMLIGAYAAYAATASSVAIALKENASLALAALAAFLFEALLLGMLVANISFDEWLLLGLTRYFSWRAAFNALSYFVVWPEHAQCCRSLLSLPHATLRAVALAADFSLGMFILLPMLALAFLPRATWLHTLCLFYTTKGRLKKSSRDADKAKKSR
eukprot:6209419-Pleurochrysis_carterae.AAC.1